VVTTQSTWGVGLGTERDVVVNSESSHTAGCTRDRYQHIMTSLSTLLILAISVNTVYPWCTIGNPYWSGSPTVEQVSLTSVRISWPGLLEREDCADSILVKFFKASNSHDYGMSDPLDVSTNTYIVRDVVPNLAYKYQVVAREDKGFIGVDWNRSPTVTFTTKKSNIVVTMDDPLPPHQSGQVVNAKTVEEAVIPVYNPEPTNVKTILNGEIKDNDVLGMKLEVFMGIVIGSLIVVIVAAGIVYNCIKKNQIEKDIELQFDSDSEDEEDSEEEEEEEELARDNNEAEKYNMVLPLTEQKTSDKMSPLNAPKFTEIQSYSTPT